MATTAAEENAWLNANSLQQIMDAHQQPMIIREYEALAEPIRKCWEENKVELISDFAQMHGGAPFVLRCKDR